MKKSLFLLLTILFLSGFQGCASPEPAGPAASESPAFAGGPASNQAGDMDNIVETNESNTQNEPQANHTEADAVFKVEGTKIIGPDGNEFLIKGVNVNGPGWCFPRDTLQDLGLIIDIWRFNTVRLCAATKWDSWAAGYNKDLDALVKAFTEKGIVVMLELHDYTGIWPPMEEGYRTAQNDIIRPLKDLTAWWADKAERFWDNPYVWFNIMNEPGAGNSREDAEMWLYVHDTVIKAIRDTGAENIIVLDDHGWGQASGYYGGKASYDSAVISMGPEINRRYDNLVFSLHVYDAWTDGGKRFDRYFTDAKALGLCVILGEFGVFKNSIGQHNAVKNMYDSAIPHGIGRIYWAWDDNGLPMTTGDNGRGYMIDRTDGEMPGNLSWAGEMVWLDNHGLLNAPVPMYELDLPLLINPDFENGMEGWQNWGGASAEKNASHNGTAALKIASGGTGGGGQPLNLKTNTAYVLSLWGRGTGDVGVKYRTDDEDPYEHHNTIRFASDAWSEKHITFVTPDEIYGPIFFIWKGSASAELYLDDILLAESP